MHGSSRFRGRLCHGQGRLRPRGLGSGRGKRRIDQRGGKQSDGHTRPSSPQAVLRLGRKVRCPFILGLAQLTKELGSYKFHRHFPLSQYDLPTHTPSILSFPVLSARSSDTHDQNSGTSPEVAPGPDDGNSRARQSSQAVPEWRMTAEQISCNPEVDYTR